MSEGPKITHGWTLIGINGYPVLDAATNQPEDAMREQECVVMWKHDYDAMQEEKERAFVIGYQAGVLAHGCQTVRDPHEVYQDYKRLEE
jgi:hypothetical protein